jgi:hypothetical protein
MCLLTMCVAGCRNKARLEAYSAALYFLTILPLRARRHFLLALQDCFFELANLPAEVGFRIVADFSPGRTLFAATSALCSASYSSSVIGRRLRLFD